MGEENKAKIRAVGSPRVLTSEVDLRAFKARWPDRERENDLASQRQKDLTLARIPDTARRAYRQDVHRRFGFCLDDEDVVVAATMIEQALHFPGVSIERVLTRADRLARTGTRPRALE